MNDQWIFWVAMAAYAVHMMEEFFYDWKNWANHAKKFSPGLFTAVILFFPIGTYSFRIAIENGVQNNEIAISVFTGILLMASPIALLKTRSLPFFKQTA